MLTKQPRSSFLDRNIDILDDDGDCNAQWQGRGDCVEGRSDGVASDRNTVGLY
jgi:hypothetical protein